MQETPVFIGFYRASERVIAAITGNNRELFREKTGEFFVQKSPPIAVSFLRPADP
jgi:hypothetical protein